MSQNQPQTTGAVDFRWEQQNSKDIDSVILEVKNLKQHFPIQSGFFQRVVGYTKAVDGVSFFLHEQEVLGLVGESGCGKTTTGARSCASMTRRMAKSGIASRLASALTLPSSARKR